ncbi:MAG: YdcF family protein [Lachnospiraceae bacterium]|nr:YdcF family protein [Lachnospiraceae bacterium]
MKFTMHFLRITGAVSLLYLIFVLIVSGRKTSFLWFWPATAAGCFLVSAYLHYVIRHASSTSLLPAKILTGVIWTCLIVFLAVESVIITSSMKSPDTNADYVIILGAQVRGDKPSKTLNMRIEAAYKYLAANPDSIAICSGGQGEGENISEAECIANGLTKRGIDPSRILLENQSTNTVQNLSFSKAIIGDPNCSVVLVTSDFHMYRALKIAAHQGFTDITPCSAKEFLVTTPGYYIREFFALTKDMICKNL